MTNFASQIEAKFHIGQIVHHRLFDYIGVIFDIDPVFQGNDEWYEKVALSKPPKDEPWYQILVNEAIHTTYVAEQNLKPASAPQKIIHPFVDSLFSEFDGKKYKSIHHSH